MTENYVRLVVKTMSGYNIGQIRYSGGFKRHKPVLISTLCKLTSVLNDALGPYFDAMQDNVGLKRRNRLALTSIAGFLSKVCQVTCGEV